MKKDGRTDLQPLAERPDEKKMADTVLMPLHKDGLCMRGPSSGSKWWKAEWRFGTCDRLDAPAGEETNGSSPLKM